MVAQRHACRRQRQRGHLLLLETAKASGLEPYTWLRHVLRDLPAAKTVDDVAALHTPDLTCGTPS